MVNRCSIVFFEVTQKTNQFWTWMWFGRTIFTNKWANWDTQGLAPQLLHASASWWLFGSKPHGFSQWFRKGSFAAKSCCGFFFLRFVSVGIGANDGIWWDAEAFTSVHSPWKLTFICPGFPHTSAWWVLNEDIGLGLKAAFESKSFRNQWVSSNRHTQWISVVSIMYHDVFLPCAKKSLAIRCG